MKVLVPILKSNRFIKFEHWVALHLYYIRSQPSISVIMMHFILYAGKRIRTHDSCVPEQMSYSINHYIGEARAVRTRKTKTNTFAMTLFQIQL